MSSTVRNVLLSVALGCVAALTIASSSSPVNASDGDQVPWSESQVISIDSMVKWLGKADKPVIFQVGFQGLFQNSHIPGSIFAGPGMKPEGIEKLKEAVAKLSPDTPIVLYCGCCPFQQCPNVKPAFEALKTMGFKKLTVLDIPKGFGPDWDSKGFPIERTHP